MRMNPRKVFSPNGIPGHVLKTFKNQLSEDSADIFHLSIPISEVSTCFKRTSIMPVPKKSKVTSLIDY